jgi:anaerobic selenocysteine-containing dehydrogenase
VGWRVSAKDQPAQSRFIVAPVDAPNVNGARMLGLLPGTVHDPQAAADVSALRSAVEAGTVPALYVFDPGPDGSIGSTQWIVDARLKGTLPLLVVQGVLLTDLARAADFVLPGASFVEKEASYTNDQRRLQATARAIAAPGEAVEDWQVIVGLGRALGVQLDYATSDSVRRDIATQYRDVEGLREIAALEFSRPIGAKHWFESSNPSERWKWDLMYQDMPPTKFAGEPFSTNFDSVIPLKEVK